VRYKKRLKDNKHNSLHLAWKYAQTFVLRHYLLLKAHSVPRATLLENCLFFGADNVCGQISKHISAPNGGYCLYNPLCSKVAHKLIKPPAALKFQHIAYLTFPVVSWSITPSCFWKAEMEGWKKTSDELSLLGYYYISYHVTSHITWKYFHKFRSSNLFFFMYQ